MEDDAFAVLRQSNLLVIQEDSRGLIISGRIPLQPLTGLRLAECISLVLGILHTARGLGLSGKKVLGNRDAHRMLGEITLTHRPS